MRRFSFTEHKEFQYLSYFIKTNVLKTGNWIFRWIKALNVNLTQFGSSWWILAQSFIFHQIKNICMNTDKFLSAGFKIYNYIFIFNTTFIFINLFAPKWSDLWPLTSESFWCCFEIIILSFYKIKDACWIVGKSKVWKNKS